MECITVQLNVIDANKREMRVGLTEIKQNTGGNKDADYITKSPTFFAVERNLHLKRQIFRR